jgi:DNA-directed RNA polymerase specialized sigma24 family protein
VQRAVDEEFAQYVRARQHRLLRAAFLVCGDARLAGELLEGALAKLAVRWHRLGTEDPDVFVRRTLYRQAVSSSHRAGREWLDLRGAEPVATDGSADLGGVGERVDLERALELLTPRQRAVLVLRFFEDRTEEDAAEVLGLSVGTVRRQGQAALTSLRALLPDLATAAGDLS